MFRNFTILSQIKVLHKCEMSFCKMCHVIYDLLALKDHNLQTLKNCHKICVSSFARLTILIDELPSQ